MSDRLVGDGTVTADFCLKCSKLVDKDGKPRYCDRPNRSEEEQPKRRGRYQGETVPCPKCPGNVRIKVKRDQPTQEIRPVPIKWSYCVTTVPKRRREELPRTLDSLRAAGFDKPRLVVDGDNDSSSWEIEFGLDVTCRRPALGIAASWAFALMECYLRDPWADRFAVFQDDFVTVKNLRAYLDACKYPDRGYWNLYTFPSNQELAPKDRAGWYESNQLGKGAVALVFSREAVSVLLGDRLLIDRFQDKHRGWRSIDGGIVTRFRNAGWKEWVHNPSLTQHTGTTSTVCKRKNLEAALAGKGPPHVWSPNHLATSFPGQDFDATELLK